MLHSEFDPGGVISSPSGGIRDRLASSLQECGGRGNSSGRRFPVARYFGYSSRAVSQRPVSSATARSPRAPSCGLPPGRLAPVAGGIANSAFNRKRLVRGPRRGQFCLALISDSTGIQGADDMVTECGNSRYPRFESSCLLAPACNARAKEDVAGRSWRRRHAARKLTNSELIRSRASIALRAAPSPDHRQMVIAIEESRLSPPLV